MTCVTSGKGLLEPIRERNVVMFPFLSHDEKELHVEKELPFNRLSSD